MKYAIAVLVVAGFFATTNAHAVEASECVKTYTTTNPYGRPDTIHARNGCNRAINVLVEGSNNESWGPFQVDSGKDLPWDPVEGVSYKFAACVAPENPTGNENRTPRYYDRGYYCK